MKKKKTNNNLANRYVDRRQEPVTFGQIILEWLEGTAIYARQSTKNQRIKNLASAEVQTIQLLEFAYKAGAPQNEKTVLFDENISEDGAYKNASGTLRIDQREGLSALCEYIEQGAKVVVCFLIDRLFRDEDMIEPVTFAKLCKEHNCKIVLYSGMVYDLNNDMHYQQFFMEALAAANFLKMQRVRLHGNKMYISRKGMYDGRTLSVGYIVDRRKELPDGKPNPGWKKYVVYPPHASIVLWLFQRFYELNGNMAQLCREVKERNNGYLFPPFDASIEKENRKINLGEYDKSRKRLPPSPLGYRVSRSGLVSILTNRDYLGEWRSEGVLVKANNHDPIVPEDLFLYAYTSLLTTTIPAPTHTRGRNKQIPALLDGFMTSPEGKVYVLTPTIGDKQYLLYTVRQKDSLVPGNYVLATSVYDLDGVFSSRLLELLEHTPDFAQWEQQVKEEDGQQAARNKRLRMSLEETVSKLTAIEVALDTLTTPVLIKKKEEDYARLLVTKTELEEKLETPQRKNSKAHALQFKELIRALRDKRKWDTCSFDVRKKLIRALTTSVTISCISSHWIGLDVTWLDSDWGGETAYVYRRRGATPVWEEEELTTMLALYPTHEREELLRMFPTHNWSALISQAHKYGVKREVKERAGEIPKRLTYQDWLFMHSHGIVMTEGDMALLKTAYWSQWSKT